MNVLSYLQFFISCLAEYQDKMNKIMFMVREQINLSKGKQTHSRKNIKITVTFNNFATILRNHED